MKREISVRKILSPILAVALVAVTAFGGAAFAADVPGVTARVNYAAGQVEATFESDILYVTDVMFYLLDEDAAFSNIQNAKRVGLAEAVPGEYAKCAISIGDDLSDGDYKIYAVAGGSSEISAYSQGFRIMHSANASIALANVNGANAADIAQKVYNAFEDVFDFEETAVPVWKSNYLYEIRTDDYAGSFKTINDIDAAWKMADVLKVINDTPASGLADVIEQNKQLLNFDTTNIYYTAYQNSALALFDDMAHKYSAAEFEAAMNKSIAIAAVNGCEIEDLDEIFKAYSDALEINEYMERYAAVSKSDFARPFDNFTAQTTQQIKEKFVSVLQQLENADGESGGTTINGGGGTGGGAGGGGGNIAVSGAASPGNTPGNNSFTDVNTGHWAYSHIMALCNMGILNGYADGTFKCDASITREEFAKVVVAAFGLSDNGGAYSGYSDIAADHWASTFIKIATVNGVINGVGEGKFGAGERISRQDAAVMIGRAAKAKGIALDSQTAVSFADGASIASYASEAVNQLAAAKIINGFADGTFKPSHSITRAETAKIVYSVITK